MLYIIVIIIAVIVIYVLSHKKSFINYSMDKSIKLDKILKKYTKNPSDNIIDDIYNLCIEDNRLNEIIKKYGATKDEFLRLYYFLYASCPCWGKDGNFIPISSFVFVLTLDHILANKEDFKSIDISMLMDFFNV